MSITDWISKIIGLGGSSRNTSGNDIRELARRLGTFEQDIAAVRPEYREIRVKKRSGGIRLLLEPSVELKKLQRCILHKLLKHLKTHEAAQAYETGRSIVTNAQPHTNKELVIKVDLVDFFPKTRMKRIRDYFLFCGWNEEAAGLLTHLTVWNGGLPQGAPTSPRLANLVNFAMDARLTGLAHKYGGCYTRYADDLTFSFQKIISIKTSFFLTMVSGIVKEYGYQMHGKEKLRVMTYARCQSVTGLVVNEKVDLPRSVRKWLRAVEHHQATGRQTTLSESQLNGWKSLRQMIIDQRRTPGT